MTSGHDPDCAAPDRRGAWTRYWATGALHSCTTSFTGNYEGAIAAFWRQAFDDLRDGARVLDIGTGNGPLPRLLCEAYAHKSARCDAVDLAEVCPAWHAELPADLRARLRFHGATSAEALPFGDATFDLVASQYGLEYSALELSLIQVARVLAGGGALRCVMHHHDSISVRHAAEELRHLDWLTASGGLLDVARGMVEPLTRATSAEGRASLQADASAQALRERFNGLQAEAERRIDASTCPDLLHEARELIAAALNAVLRGDADAGRQRLAAYPPALADARLRLVELQRCALDPAAMATLCGTLRRHGVTTAAEPLHERGVIVGWALRGRREPARS